MIVNGVTLPDIPAEVLAEYPYAVIAIWEKNGTDVEYCLVVSDYPFAYAPANTRPYFPGMPDLGYIDMECAFPSGGSFVITSCPIGGGNEWLELSEVAESSYFAMNLEVYSGPEGTTEKYTIVWANHDVCKATSIVDTGTTFEVTVGTEVYFAKSEEEAPKPTRVSIGRSLVDGYAKEVQRLTGTTEQMNAIQIREKLSTVKAAIKIGDTVLPPIPDGVLAEYPYVVIMGSVDNGVYVGGMLMASKNRFSFGNKNLVESAYDTILSYGPGAGYEIMAGENEWRFESNVDGIGFPVTKIETMEVLPVWANHDIYIADSFDSVTGELTDSLDLYLSERQNFNGVWLPKVPEDVLKQYPYNVILKISRSGMSVYMLAGLTEELTFAPKEIATTVVECDGILYTKQPCTITSFMYTGAGNWLEQGVSNNDTFKVHVGMTDISYDVFWCNSDVCIATAYDTATNIATIGTELYFPPLPTIDTDRVSIGYDLCDGIVEEVQRLSGDQEKMDALHAYWKLTTVV